jgi:hypothetical protein
MLFCTLRYGTFLPWPDLILMVAFPRAARSLSHDAIKSPIRWREQIVKFNHSRVVG